MQVHCHFQSGNIYLYISHQVFENEAKKFKKQNSTENVMPNGSTFTIVRGDDKFILG